MPLIRITINLKSMQKLEEPPPSRSGIVMDDRELIWTRITTPCYSSRLNTFVEALLVRSIANSDAKSFN